MPYRYTGKKNRQANRKLQKRQQNKKVVKVKSSRSQVKTNRSTAPSHSQKKRSSATTQTQKKPTQGKNAQKRRQRTLVAALSQFFVWLVLVILIILLVANSLLPQFASLKQATNILLVGSTSEQTAQYLYLIQVLPDTNTVTISALDGNVSVPITGGYGNYPLGSLSPLLHLEENNLAQITAAYNFALKQAIDEVYFLPTLTNWQNKEMALHDLSSAAKKELWPLYFTVKSSEYFYLQNNNDRLLGKTKLTECPTVLINAAGISGLAKQTSQMLEMNGLQIINWGNTGEKLTTTQIFYDENQTACLEAVKILQRVLPANSQYLADQGNEAQKHRAKMVIYLDETISD